MVVANDKREKKEQDNQRINNIRGANIVVLMRPIAKKVEHDFKNYVYSITAATWSQKKNLEAKKFQPTLRVTKPVERNFKKSLAN